MAERVTTILTSFNGGEASPRMAGRIDQKRYFISPPEMVGWLPLLQGPALAAPGTFFVGQAAGPCRLIPFEPYPTQGHVLEFSDNALRFYTNDARMETSPGVPLEVATPWSAAEAALLDYQGSIDVMYLVGAGKQQHQLTRTDADSFTLDPLTLRNGPIGDPNFDETVTVTTSGATGGITITASAAIFVETDVGGLFEIAARDFNTIPSWEPGIETAVGQKRTWAGKVYQQIEGTRTGSNPPIHDEGAENDGSRSGTDVNGKGPYGCKWLFLHGTFGLARITGYTGPTQVSATVIKRLADSLTSAASYRWAFGAFSDTRGWPDAVCLWDECLVLIKGSEGYTSVIGDLDNYERRDSSGDFQRDLAGRFTLPNRDRCNWCAADRVLLLSGEKAEYTVERILTQGGDAGPPIFKVSVQATNGSRRIKPIQADGRMLFVQRAGRKLLELGYAITSDRYTAPDATRFADHIGAAGFTALAWQQEPERTLWAVRGDGSLAALAYAPDDELLGWAPRPLGGGMLARSIAKITDPDGRRDQIWIAAETFEGDHWILRMAKQWETGDDPASQMFVDAGLRYSGAPDTDGGSAEHLAGKTVQVLADGKPHPDITIGAGGEWAIGYPASVVTMGFGFPCRMTSMKIEAGHSEGTAQGKIQRIIDVAVRVIETQGIRVSVSDGEDQLPVETRLPEDAMDQAVPLFTGDLRLNTIGTYERGGTVTIERYQPTAACVLAIIPGLETGE